MENFVVSARKYRPATFNTVVGQSHITQTLKNAIARGQLSHAYLFTGPRGVGKTTCARIFAKAINCLQPTADFEACGECESCKAFDSGRSFNIHELDAASNNSVDDIRALNEKVRIAPQVGKYSLYIIDEVHMLSTGAFNAFLKTLEEPPAYAIFILATTEKHKILPTILSRCQSYDFRRIRVDDIVEYLKFIAGQEGVSYDTESLHLIAAKADGGMRDALSTFDRVVSFCGNELQYAQVASCIGALDYSTYFSTVDFALEEDFGSVLMTFDEILARGFEGHQFISGLLEHIRNLIVASNSNTVGLLEATDVMVDAYKEQAMNCGIEFLMNAMNLISLADTGYRSATNRRLHAELALIKLCSLKKKESSVGFSSTDEHAVTEGAERSAGVPIIYNSYALPQIVVAPTSTQHVEGNVTSSMAKEVGGNVDISARPNIAKAADATENAVSKVTSNADVDVAATAATGATGGVGAATGATVAAAVGRGISKISISSLSATRKAETQAQINTRNGGQNTSATELTAELSEMETEELLRANFGRIIDLWNSRHRPRIATALMSNSIKSNQILISVPDQGPEQEVIQNKLQIESDILDLLGVRATISVQITETQMPYTPVSQDQKLKHLVEINPNILRLRDELDLTT